MERALMGATRSGMRGGRSWSLASSRHTTGWAGWFFRRECPLAFSVGQRVELLLERDERGVRAVRCLGRGPAILAPTFESFAVRYRTSEAPRSVSHCAIRCMSSHGGSAWRHITSLAAFRLMRPDGRRFWSSGGQVAGVTGGGHRASISEKGTLRDGN